MKMYRVDLLALLVSVLGTVQAASDANATLATFDDQAAFLSATGATAAGPVPTGGGGDTSFVIGGLTFTNHPPSSFYLLPPDLGARIPGFDLAINDVESFNVDSATPLFAFGFDFHEIENDPNLFGPFLPNTFGPFFESEFQVTLLDGGSFVDSFTYTRPNDSLEFVGVWSTEPFNRIELREAVGGLEDELFGNFLTGVTAAGVPEASVFVFWSLMSAAGLVAACLRRKTPPAGACPAHL